MHCRSDILGSLLARMYIVGLEGVNEILIPFLVDPTDARLLLDAVIHVYGLLDIVRISHLCCGYFYGQFVHEANLTLFAVCPSVKRFSMILMKNRCLLIAQSIFFVLLVSHNWVLVTAEKV